MFLVIALLFVEITAYACKYTIREIGFSTLSKVTYVVYRVDENSSLFPEQLAQNFSEANVVGSGVNAHADPLNPVVKFVEQQQLKLPAYVLATPDGSMLALDNDAVRNQILNSPVQQELLEELPKSYAAVILIEGKNAISNQIASDKIIKACTRIENILPNMPKYVAVGPKLIVIPNDKFDEEKVMLWSFGIESIPEDPMALVVYGKGRIMGEQIGYMNIQEDIVYKYLSIIGADCECGLDRKWMLGAQMPMNWPKETRQDLSDELGFDVDNPMVLTEMSRILAIENRAAADPDGISYEPVIIDLDTEFNEVPVVRHTEQSKSESSVIGTSRMMFYYILILVLLIGAGVFFILRSKK